VIPNRRSESEANRSASQSARTRSPFCVAVSLRALLIQAAVALGALGCTGAADIPSVPDLSGLEESYEAPSAELMGAPAVQAAVESVPDLQQLAAAFRTTGDLVQPIDEARETAGEATGLGLRVRGTIAVEVRCPGPESTPVYDAATNGTFTLSLAVQNNNIRSSFGAEADRCISSTSVSGTRIPLELDGRLEMDLGGDINLRQGWALSNLLFSLDGTFKVGSAIFRNISARLVGDRFEFLQETPQGSVVLFVTDSGLGLRAQDATWFCDVDTGLCAVR
jgi:hypothetical protein